MADLLGDVAHTIRWDQRGCGRSGRRRPYTFIRFVADLDVVRRHHGAERVHLLGHSWGAMLALCYALEHPERVASLIYVSGTGIDPDHTWKPAAVPVLIIDGDQDVRPRSAVDSLAEALRVRGSRSMGVAAGGLEAVGADVQVPLRAGPRVGRRLRERLHLPPHLDPTALTEWNGPDHPGHPDQQRAHAVAILRIGEQVTRSNHGDGIVWNGHRCGSSRDLGRHRRKPFSRSRVAFSSVDQ